MDVAAERRTVAAAIIELMTDLPNLYLTKEAVLLLSDRELRRGGERGTLTRLCAGVYIPTAEWNALDADGKYRARVRAVALRARSTPQFSHDSAAAMWRLPSVGPWPRKAHQLIDAQRATSSRVGVVRHARGMDSRPEQIDGVTVTSLARTLIDVSCTSAFVRAVAMVDDGLRTTRKGDPRWGWVTSNVNVEALSSALHQLAPYAGSVKAQRVLDFSTSKSGSPGESVARVQFFALGFPPPQLQVEIRDERGFIGYADFYWPELDLVVEFDGRSKYGGSRRYQRNLSPREILLEEKDREDRIRRVVTSFARIDWRKTSNRRVLAAHLLPHGLQPAPRALQGETARALGII